MKKCPKCKKTYDDSWGICIHCNEPLINIDAEGSTQVQKTDEEYIIEKVPMGTRIAKGVGAFFLGAICLGFLQASEIRLGAILMTLIMFGLLSFIFNVTKAERKVKKSKVTSKQNSDSV